MFSGTSQLQAGQPSLIIVFRSHRVASDSLACLMAICVASDTGRYCIILTDSSSLSVLLLNSSMHTTSSVVSCLVLWHIRNAVLRVSAMYILVPFL